MKKLLIVAIAILALSAMTWADETEKRPMTVDDSLKMVSVGNVMISPCGEWVFFSKSELNWKDNKRESKYYLVPAAGGEAFQYIGKAGGSSFQFSPDGKYLSFKRSVDKNSQVFLMRTSGGEAVQLTKHKNSVGSYQWSDDASKIFFTATEPRDKDAEKEYKAGADMIFVDEGPNGQRAGNWSNLWVFDVASKEETKITDEEMLIGSFDACPSGSRVIFTARFDNRRNTGDKSEIYLIKVNEKEKVRLTDNNSPESGLSWAPDGKSFIFSAADDKEWLNRNSKFYVMNPVTKEYRLLSGKFEGGPRRAVWTADAKHILFGAQQKTNSNLYKVDVATGDYEQLTDVVGSLSVAGFSKDRTKIAYTFSDYDTPSDVYVTAVDDFRPVKLTDANPWIEKEIQLAEMKVISWKSVKDFEIEGLFHLPVGFKEGDKAPLILHIHGGPAGAFRNSFSTRYHVYAGLGYASLSPNVRGSSGYTDHLREGNTVAKEDGIGMGDFQDLMLGVDSLIEQGFVDKNRMGVKGWSYGGILGGWTITHTDRFKAASLGAGVYDWASEYGPGFNYDVRLWHIGGTPWDNPEGYREQSALTHVKNITTPTIIIHGVNDTTDTEAQSMNLFTAIKDIGKVPVRYIKAPREPHGFREPRHQRTRDIEEIRWIQKYVLGEEWTPWEREKAKEDDKKDEAEEK